jgi:RAQPRD family integrative conjugative element protein
LKALILIISSLWLLPFPVLANPDVESGALAQLVHELDALQPILKRAEQHTNQDARVRFNYTWLRDDLERIRSGIRAHLVRPRQQPRTISPLKGDYRE